MHQIINHQAYTISQFQKLFQNSKSIEIPDETIQIVKKSRQFLEEKIRKTEKPIYGINTGFGELCNVKIDSEHLDQLQINLVRSHSCGIGKPVPDHISRLMLLLKIKSFTSGYSGVSVELVNHLIAFYNSGAIPEVFEKGSLGASGDLVPLAHMTLPLLGEGQATHHGKLLSGKEILNQIGLQPFKLKSKEGLAMLNGTQFMLAYGLDCIWRAQKIMDNGLYIFAMAVDAFHSRTDFLHQGIHAIRPHKGQEFVAQRLRELLSDSPIAQLEKSQIQDPYSVRCLPQVLGASLDAINYVKNVMETELNSITDNPLIFEEEDLVVSGGNFHGQPLALSLDFLAISLAEIANIAERLLYKIIGGERGLPIFLTENPGLESGFMIPQYAAAALVSQNKQLATPASVDSIVSSNGQEDHVSMGANAALKCAEVVQNTESVLGILLLAAAQAMDFRRPMKTSPAVEKVFSAFRNEVPERTRDEEFKTDFDKAANFVRNKNFEEL
jgi:histidine ammonia-lyase